MDNILARKIQLRHNIDPCKPTGSTSTQGRKTTETSWKKVGLLRKKVGFTRLSLTSDLGPRTSNLGPRTSDLGPRTSDLGPRSSELGPRTSDLDLGPRTSDLDLGPRVGLVATCVLENFDAVPFSILTLSRSSAWVQRLQLAAIFIMAEPQRAQAEHLRFSRHWQALKAKRHTAVTMTPRVTIIDICPISVLFHCS